MGGLDFLQEEQQMSDGTTDHLNNNNKRTARVPIKSVIEQIKSKLNYGQALNSQLASLSKIH